jgi:inner membrane protein
MDPVTHTLVGVGMANGFFRRRIGPRAVPILALASNLPDVDALVHLTGNPHALLLRRTFGHSLLTVPIWALLLALLLKRVAPRLGLAERYGLCLLGAGVHLVFDLINSFGVRLLWPVSPWRPELAIVFIVDPILTGLLAAPLLPALWPRLRGRLALLSRASLALVAGYLILCAASRSAAGVELRQRLQVEGRSPSFTYLFPEPLGPHRWRGVARQGGRYDLYLVHAWTGRVEPRGAVATTPDAPAVERVRRTPFGAALQRFFKAPVWTVSPAPQADGSIEVAVSDLRFRSLVLDRGAVFRYTFRVHPDGEVQETTRFTIPDRDTARGATR